MRNKRFFFVLIGALLFGLLAAVSVSRYLSSAQAYTKNLNNIAVAKVAIPLGTKIIPEQAEKLALAATEGKLQLVMRNSVDQGDTQTTGVNKRGLLSGEHAKPAPEPGALKSEQPKPEV